MFVSHYAVGIALKKQSQMVPLWLIFIAVQLSDILAFVLILPGVERMLCRVRNDCVLG